MFGATFVFPLIMGLDPNLAIMMSGVATILFLIIVKGQVPSYLGTSASFVGGVVAIRANGGDSSDVVGAILVAGVVLALVGLLIHFAGTGVVNKVLPPAVTGAVVMLIGFNLAPVAAGIYWPQDQWVALATMTFVIVASLALRGFLARISILLGLIFGYLLSVLLDVTTGPITSVLGGATEATEHDRINFDSVGDADWFGFPDFTAPSFSLKFSLLVLPAVIALVAENAGHVKAVAEMTKRDLDPVIGRAVFADGVGTVVASAVGGSPTTTYAENIGVMAATRVYSTAAYYVAAVVAILLGLVPKFGALINIVPGGVLGGITVVLYGMIGLLGAKIWKENRVDFANPINLVPLAAGIIIGIGNVTLTFTDDFSLTGIALGSIVAVVAWHLARALAPADMKAALLREGAVLESASTLGHTGDQLGGSDPSSYDEVERRAREPEWSPQPWRGHAQPVKPAPFRYADPGTLDEALAVLSAEGEGAKVLAGGQSLLPLLSMRLAAPATLVDINRVPGLDTVEATGDGVTVGALVRHNTLLHDGAAARVQPLLARATANVAHPAIRNRGTTVGSIAHADPSGEMTSVLALTDGSVTVATPDGVETIGWRDLFVGPLETSIHGPAVVTSAFFPALAPRSGTAFAEVARRKGDYAVCGGGVVVTLDADRRVAAVRAAYVSVGIVPEVHDLTDAVIGQPADSADWAAAGALARTLVEPDTDLHASADYRRLLVGVLTERMLPRLRPRRLGERNEHRHRADDHRHRERCSP